VDKGCQALSSLFQDIFPKPEPTSGCLEMASQNNKFCKGLPSTLPDRGFSEVLGDLHAMNENKEPTYIRIQLPMNLLFFA